jgi:hypothetical protein
MPAFVIGRWIARILGTLIALGFLTFVVAEGPPPLSPTFLCMAVTFAGLLLAWKWEGLGGLLILGGCAARSTQFWFGRRRSAACT